MKTEKTQENKIKRQVYTGVVVSDKMKDTTVISVSRYVKNAKYHKFELMKKKIMAHTQVMMIMLMSLSMPCCCPTRAALRHSVMV